MRQSVFEKVFLIGFGTIYKDILKYLISTSEQWDYELEVIEHESHPTSRIGKLCEEAGVSCHKIDAKDRLEDFFLSQAKSGKAILIVSAGNKYLFPDKLLSYENITVVNFHNALLLKYPGRNAPSWAIYNGEQQTGATWHYVTSEVDAGNIIWQETCEITPDIKAYELSRTIMGMAYKGFMEIAESLLDGSAASRMQEISGAKRKIYYSKDVPNHGVVNSTDSAEDAYRLLRAMDFGFHPIFQKPVLLIGDADSVGFVPEKYTIRHYKKIVPKDTVYRDEKGKEYYLKFSDGSLLKLNVVAFSEENIEYSAMAGIKNWGGVKKEYNALRVAVGWEKASEKLLMTSLEHSVLVTARNNGTLIGMARLVSDLGMIAVIADVMVHPDYQGRGIGDTLVRQLLAAQKEVLEEDDFCYISVLATRRNERFYEQMGFMRRPNIMLGAGMTMKLAGNKTHKYER